MSILRSERTAGFTIIPNALINDAELSLKDKGLLLCMLSKPDNWKFTQKNLAAETGVTVSTINSICKTLQALGYLTINRLQTGESLWIVSDHKKPHSKKSNLEKKPHSKKPNLEKPNLENQNVLINTDYNKTNINKTKGGKSFRFTPPSLDEIKKYINDNNYLVDTDAFFHFYESKGWMIGKNKMKNWKSAIAQWHIRNKQTQPKNEGVELW